MPKYYCDYCDLHLTSDKMFVRKTHLYGRKHKDNVRLYYQTLLEEQGQQLIDATTSAFKRQIAVPSNNMMAPSPGVPPLSPYAYGIRPLPPYPWLGHPVIPDVGAMMMGPYGPTLPMMGMQPERSMGDFTVSVVPASPVEIMRPVMTDSGLK